VTFQHPGFFLLILIVPLLWFFRLRKDNFSQGLSVSSLSQAAAVPRVPFLFLYASCIFESIALISLIAALALPSIPDEDAENSRKGIAIEMVLDRSGSMGIFTDRNLTENRLDAAKKAFLSFLKGPEGKGRRPGDRIGLITFARYAVTVAPLTTHHEILASYTDMVHIPEKKDFDGTSIGDALALAAARLKALPESELPSGSRVMILLSDGQNTSGEREPEDALELIKDWGFRIYTISVSGGFYEDPLWGLRKVPDRMGGDDALLNKLAEETGGSFFRASDSRDLEKIYKSIDSLETHMMDDTALQTSRAFYTPFIISSLIFLCLSMILNYYLLRRIV